MTNRAGAPDDVTEKDRIIGLLADAGIKINGPDPWDLHILDERTWNRLFAQGTLGLGEAYMDGWWDAADLAEFFSRVLNRASRKSSASRPI